MLLGVDIGATRTKLGLLNPSTVELKEQTVVDTPQGATTEEFLAWVQETLQNFLRGTTLVEALGVGIAGFVTYEGIVEHSPNMPALQQLPFRAWLSALFPFPIVVDNDANVAAWAEYRVGAARDVTDCLYITLGTGVGGALIVGGKLWRGVHGGAGDVGHMVVDITAS
ncbi:MAG: ROK family protein, partial [Bacteroidota bacterium]|nr:ROK family protein [Bacteroidota bacterium]